MFADLHLHTTHSDGSLTPHEIISKANALGIELISVCDHNTVTAYPLLHAQCINYGIKLIPGVEIDCYMGERYVHLLGYGFNLDNTKLLGLLSDCSKKMQYQNDAVVFNMAHDYSIDLDEYAAYISPPEIGGYKNSNYLLHKGIIKEIPEYFPLLRRYGVQQKDIGLPQLEHVCAVIKSAGGVPVLAHPWDRLDRENFLDELQKAIDSGVMGIECFYPSHDEKITQNCLDFCNTRDICITAGSDEHGIFNRTINGVVYEMGEIMVDTDRLNLKDLV